MVWFQCEDCGENLKKPKLPNHFRICSATKLSCIDCGVTFGQGSVQGHTQCITEAEKYGPKGRGKPANGTTSKSNKDAKQQPDVDINVGLSERPPWFCSLCNTKATSKQTLLLHADGKKHRAKAKAFHAVNAPKQESKQSEESAPDANPQADCSVKSELPASKHADEEKAQEVSKPNGRFTNSETENAQSSSKKKRKLDASGVDGTEKKTADDATDEVVNGVVKRRKADENFENGKHNDDKVTKPDGAQEDTRKKIKWKKLIKSALKSSPDGVLKIKKLKTIVVKSLQESSITGHEIQLSKMIEQKINSSSRFKVDGKCVHLVAKD